MSWIEEVSYQYRPNEYFFVDLPAIFQFCLPSLVVEFIRLSGLQIGVNVLYQLITTDTLFSGRRTLKNLLSSVIGSLLLLYFFPPECVLFLVGVLVVTYLLIADKRIPFLVTSALLATGWALGLYTPQLRVLQGPLMIAAMKVICVLDSVQDRQTLELSTFLHYCLSPCSAVFGPIVPFDEFTKKVFQPKFSLRLMSVLGALFGTLFTFITANCVCQSVEWVYAGDDAPPYHVRFLTAYKNGLEFRLSHYFICCLSSLQMHVGAPKLATPLTNTWAIEAPRTMRDVVKSWNIPMHEFLKTTVFKRIRPVLGAALAVVATFAISAGLHLFEIRVTVVLLGLSLVSIIESRFERHLPKSVGELWLRATTFIHLAFFGCIMMGYEEDSENSYLEFVMEKWHELSFISFKILIVESVLCVAFEIWRLLRPSKK